MPPRYQVSYPTEAARHFIEKALKKIPPRPRGILIKAIESLAVEPRPKALPGVKYFETTPEMLIALLGPMAGIPFTKSTPDFIVDHLYACHHLIVNGINLSYAIDDKKNIVWLMGIS